MEKTLGTEIDLYRQMAANIPNCSIYIFDHNYDYHLAEGEEIAKMGLASDAFIGCNFFEIWPAEITTGLAPYYQDTLQGKRQTREQKKEDGYFVQHFVPILGEGEEVLFGMVVSQNVSELRLVKKKLGEADQELRSKQKLFETVVNTLGEGIIVTSKKGEILLHNPAAESILDTPLRNGTLSKVRYKMSVRRAEGGGEIADAELPLSLALNGASLDNYVTHVRNRETEKQLYLENSARPILNEKGRTESAVLLMRDISQRLEHDRQTEEKIAVLSHQNQHLENLANHHAQGLRGPAANVSILFSLLDRAETQSERDHFFAKIREASEALLHKANQMSRAAESYSSVRKSWILNEFEGKVDEFKAIFKSEISLSGLAIKTNFVKLPKVPYPAKVFETIVFELLKGAMAAARPKVRPAVFLETDDEAGVAQLCATFENLPMDMEELARDTTRIKVEANGAIDGPAGIVKAKRRVEAMGGHCQADGKHKLILTF